MISKSQTLITGVYRTGSEFLTYLIDAHPDIMASMYKINLMRFYYGKYGEFNNINLSALIDDLSFRLEMRYDISIDKTKYQKTLKNKSYGFIYDYLMADLFLKDTKKTHWAEKNQLEWRNLSKFIDIMPNGKGIHIIRDPRSVFLSFKKNTNSKVKGSEYGAVFNCLDSMNYVLNDHLKNKNIHIVNYSELVEKPFIVLEKIFNFLNLETNKINTKIIKSIINKNVNSSFQKDNERFNKQITTNRWKNELDNIDISFIEQICGKEMEKLGFEKISNKNIDIQKFANEKFRNNNLLKKAFRKFLETGEGFQKFPSDPLNPENWSI